MDDVTLGKLLTEAHRGQADYCEPEGMSVSQSSSVMFDGPGQLDGEMVDRSGQLDERNSSNAQIRTLLEEHRGMSRKSRSSRTPCSSRRRRAPTYKDNYGGGNWNFVKLINKVLQK